MSLYDDGTSEFAVSSPLTDRQPYAPALVERLLTVIAGLNADLDHDVVLRRVCQACVDLLDADAAGFLVIGVEEARLVAGVGIDPAVLGLRIGSDVPILADLARAPRRIVFGDLHRTAADNPGVLAAVGDRHTVVVTPVQARGQLVGALAVGFVAVDHRLSASAEALLDLLAGHGGAAIANALAYEDAVRRQTHEQAVIDAVADGVATIDAHGLVARWNRAAAELTGRPVEEVLGRPLGLPTGTPDDPFEHRLPDDRWVEIVATPLEDGEVVVLRDISRQKALEAAKTMFVAATSHELKTPLTVIKSFAEWLRDNGEAADSLRRKTAYEALADSAEELSHIVEKILLTARTEAGRIDLARQVVDPTRVARGTAAPFAIPGRAHVVQLDVPEQLPPVYADPHALRTALGQLLENAIKYSPDGGLISVGLKLADDSAVEFSVSDQGIGVAPGEAEYLFMPFYQGETRARSGVRGGVGLGLSIVRRLVEAHGGEVGAEGRPGRGARFWFTVPLASADERHDDQLEDAAPAGWSGLEVAPGASAVHNSGAVVA